MSKEKLLGHDLDGQRIYYWSQVNIWTGRMEHFIESAVDQKIRFHHVSDEFLAMFAEALGEPAPAVGPVAA
jgi:flagellar motor component MotA